MKRIISYQHFLGVLMIALSACAGPQRGPDKQFGQALGSAAVGAGAGAVTGFQISSATGPGAAVGAGLGAVAGGIQGFARDQAEESLLDTAAGTQAQRRVAQAHEVLQEQYRRRLDLHPTREIYPADLFFYGDEAKLRSGARDLLREIASLNKTRLGWSRLAIVSYVRATTKNSRFAQFLAEKRSKEICDALVTSGLEPRRMRARGVVIKGPLLIDPNDNPARFNQAVEIVPMDR
ncbi:MAG: hypothetical protein KDD42_06705 [Bdellovibrionales bacterium]|nr:hypothetical protein [Bdellovibrionales bacterium]